MTIKRPVMTIVPERDARRNAPLMPFDPFGPYVVAGRRSEARHVVDTGAAPTSTRPAVAPRVRLASLFSFDPFGQMRTARSA